MANTKHLGQYVQTKAGNVAHVLADENMSEETRQMLEKVIDLAYQTQINPMTKQEHYQWAYDRAVQYFKKWDYEQAYRSFISDIQKFDGEMNDRQRYNLYTAQVYFEQGLFEDPNRLLWLFGLFKPVVDDENEEIV
ncbi:hypothetical protein [Runella sp.]|uniref:hypothetical protein n=1 Tax=Runella sp. TaxID=1960881 RepID=UPI003D13DEC6